MIQKGIYALVLLCLLSMVLKAQSEKKIKNFTEISYGIYKSVAVKKDVNLSNSPSIQHTVVDSVFLLEKTENVKARIGVEFGVEYLIRSKNKEQIRLNIEWIFPNEIVDPVSNEKIDRIKYPIDLPTNFINNSNYTLEKEYELMKGIWQLNIYHNQEIIYSKKFNLE